MNMLCLSDNKIVFVLFYIMRTFVKLTKKFKSVRTRIKVKAIDCVSKKKRNMSWNCTITEKDHTMVL